MKSQLHTLLLAALLPFAAAGQEPAPAVPTPPAPPASVDPAASVAAPDVPTAAQPPEKPAAAPTESASPAVAPAPEAPPAPAAEPPLRQLDREEALPAAEAAPAAPSSGPRKDSTKGPRRRGSGSNERVAIGSDVHLAAGDWADEVVAVFGSATSDGEVRSSVVSILGNTRATGPVGQEVVAVLGNVYVNSKVGQQVVAILGDVELGPKAEVGGNIVVIGGALKRDPQAVLRGQVQNIGVFGKFGDFSWLATYFHECVLKARLLAFDARLMWAWGIAFSILGFYVLIALLFGRGVKRCAETLETRPGYSVLAALLTVLLVPVVMVLLCFTVIGIALVPFLAAALFFAGIFGKVVMLAWLGRRITGLFGDSPLGHVAVATLLGGLIVMLLYVVPVLGFLLFKVIGWLGMGVVVYTLMLVSKRDKPATPPAATTIGGTGPAAMPPAGAAGAAMPMSAGFTGASALAAEATIPPTFPSAASTMGGGAAAAAIPLTTPVVPSTLPRAGLLIRLGALALDVILVGVVLNLLPRFLGADHGPTILLVLAIYGAVMWKFKGTTIGGIVCGLRVVRTDNRELDWSTAIVRALGCFLSLIVAGLGFIWIAIDDEKQSWHDKIAGTAVVRMPKGVSLV